METTFDLKALAPDLQQVETVSFQQVGPSVRGFLASTRSSLDKYYRFAEDCSDKHGVDDMWGLRAHVLAGVNAVSGTRRGLGSVTEWGKTNQTPVLRLQLLHNWNPMRSGGAQTKENLF